MLPSCLTAQVAAEKQMKKQERVKEKSEKELKRTERQNAKEAKQAEKIKAIEAKLAKAKEGSGKPSRSRKASQGSEELAPAVSGMSEGSSENKASSSKPDGSAENAPSSSKPEGPAEKEQVHEKAPATEPEPPKKRRKTSAPKPKEQEPDVPVDERGGGDAAEEAAEPLPSRASALRKARAQVAFRKLKEAVEDPLIRDVELGNRMSFTIPGQGPGLSQIGCILYSESFYTYKPIEKKLWGSDLQGYDATRRKSPRGSNSSYLR